MYNGQVGRATSPLRSVAVATAASAIPTMPAVRTIVARGRAIATTTTRQRYYCFLPLLPLPLPQPQTLPLPLRQDLLIVFLVYIIRSALILHCLHI